MLATTEEIVAYSPRPKQRLYHESGAKYRAQIGGYGSGKTFAQLMEAIRFCLTIPSSNSIILRRTFPDLERTVINLLLTKVPEEVYGGRRRYNDQKHRVHFANGSTLYFGYSERDKDLGQYLSAEYVFVGFEEAGEFSFKAWLALAERNRCPVKFDINGEPVRPSMSLATNPFGVGYAWIKSLFVDKKPYGGMSAYDPAKYFMVHSTVFDNPTYADDKDYISTLESLPEAERRKKLYGDLESIEGAYFSIFDPRAHVVPYGEIRFREWEPCWAAQDWGFAHANVTIWMAKAEVLTETGPRVVNVAYRELVEYEKTEREIAQAINKAMGGTHEVPRNPYQRRETRSEAIVNFFLSPDAFGRKNSQRTIGDQLGDELVKVGLPRPSRADNDRESGWKLMYNLFASGDLYIADTCPQLIAAIPLLTRDPDNIEDVLKVDGAVEDDLADSFRYAVKSFLAPGDKPFKERLREELAAIPPGGSERYIRHKILEKEERTHSVPFYIGLGARGPKKR